MKSGEVRLDSIEI